MSKKKKTLEPAGSDGDLSFKVVTTTSGGSSIIKSMRSKKYKSPGPEYVRFLNNYDARRLNILKIEGRSNTLKYTDVGSVGF